MKTLCLGCMQEFDDEYKICPHCGYAVGTKADEAIHIQPGTRLHDRYIVGKVLGFGGFGVTYIAWDEKLEQKVAIKEYLPSEFSTRMPGQTQVTVFNGEKNEQFHDGLSKFVDEAKRLAKFQNEPGIVRIFDSFEDNSTAYIIMEYLQGETLASYMERMGPIDEQDAVAMLMPIMQSLQAVHAEGIIHRDIAPDNIFLTDEGEIKLIDFGASRYATTSHSRSLTVVIKQGYSPEEQYRSRGDHGPHTDVYALSATLYKMITGKTPPDAMERRVEYENKRKDILVEPRRLTKKLTRNRENAILNALNVRIEDRTPTVAAFIDELNADPPAKRIYGKIKLIDRLRWPLWLKITVPTLFAVLLTLAILLLTGVINFSKFSQEIVIPDGVVVVPEVEGMYTEEAVDLITSGKLLASTNGTIESQYIPAGKIILQTPTGGSYMDINSTVVLTVSSGKSVVSPENGISTVPYVIWETKEDAIAKLLKAGLSEPDIIEKHDDNVAVGAVIEQSVLAGEKVDEGTKITLTISIGPAAFEMPNVVGQTKDKAESTLNNKGLVVVVEYKKDDSAKEGTVLAQSIAKGTSVKRGDEVTITIATNTKTIKVANVVGKSKGDAESILKEQGFKVTVLENYDANIAAGKVISQSPEAGVSQLPGTEIVLYVSKGKQPITITFNANGGTVTPGSKTAYLSDTYGSLPTPTRDGYTFNGWYSAKSGGVKVSSNTTITTPSGHSLYAQWTPNTYTVSFDSNGGGTAPSSKKVTFGSTYGTLGTVSRSGYTFVGWFTEKNGGKEILADTEYTSTSNQTLYAHWSENGYTVTFDANGGNVSTSSKGVVYGATYGTLPTPTKSGAEFLGWYTTKDGGNKITSSSTVNITSNQTLYAHWKVNSYTITFDPTGGSVSQETKDVVFGSTYGSLPTPTKEGHTFSGWYTSSGGGTKITSSTEVTVTKAQTLYARWSINSYTITFEVGKNTSVSPKKISVKYGSAYGTLPTPTRTDEWASDFKFGGWHNSKGNIANANTIMGASDVTLYCSWSQEDCHPLYFDANGGTVSPSYRQIGAGCRYGSQGALPTPTREGYIFDGWYTSKSGGSRVDEYTRMSFVSVTIYAHWTQGTTEYVSLDPGFGTTGIEEITPSDWNAGDYKRTSIVIYSFTSLSDVTFKWSVSDTSIAYLYDGDYNEKPLGYWGPVIVYTGKTGTFNLSVSATKGNLVVSDTITIQVSKNSSGNYVRKLIS